MNNHTIYHQCFLV